MTRRANIRIGREYDFMEPDLARPQPSESPTREEFLVKFEAYQEALRSARAEWLIRRILTPNTPDSLLPANQVLILRRRLLAKVRDQARRKGPDALMVRVSGETLQGIDTISEAGGIPTRTGVVTFLVREAIEALTVKRPKRRR